MAMCGRFTLHQDTSDVAKSIGALDLSEVTPFLPSYNIAPSQEVPVILNQGVDFRNQEQLHMRLMTWGLRPAWSSGGNQNPINARSETVSEKPMFSRAYEKRRCVIPANGWFEWSIDRAQKTPWYHKNAENQTIFFAGIWESWANENGERAETFAILTKESQDDISHIHNRMPVILDTEDIDDWLNGKDLHKMVKSTNLEAYPVSKEVNSVKSSGSRLVQKIPTLF